MMERRGFIRAAIGSVLSLCGLAVAKGGLTESPTESFVELPEQWAKVTIRDGFVHHELVRMVDFKAGDWVICYADTPIVVMKITSDGKWSETPNIGTCTGYTSSWAEFYREHYAMTDRSHQSQKEMQASE